MFCRNCQTIIPDDSLFCENCGAPTGLDPDQINDSNLVPEEAVEYEIVEDEEPMETLTVPVDPVWWEPPEGEDSPIDVEPEEVPEEPETEPGSAAEFAPESEEKAAVEFEESPEETGKGVSRSKGWFKRLSSVVSEVVPAKDHGEERGDVVPDLWDEVSDEPEMPKGSKAAGASGADEKQETLDAAEKPEESIPQESEKKEVGGERVRDDLEIEEYDDTLLDTAGDMIHGIATGAVGLGKSLWKKVEAMKQEDESEEESEGGFGEGTEEGPEEGGLREDEFERWDSWEPSQKDAARAETASGGAGRDKSVSDKTEEYTWKMPSEEEPEESGSDELEKFVWDEPAAKETERVKTKEFVWGESKGKESEDGSRESEKSDLPAWEEYRWTGPEKQTSSHSETEDDELDEMSFPEEGPDPEGTKEGIDKAELAKIYADKAKVWLAGLGKTVHTGTGKAMVVAKEQFQQKKEEYEIRKEEREKQKEQEKKEKEIAERRQEREREELERQRERENRTEENIIQQPGFWYGDNMPKPTVAIAPAVKADEKVEPQDESPAQEVFEPDTPENDETAEPETVETAEPETVEAAEPETVETAESETVEAAEPAESEAAEADSEPVETETESEEEESKQQEEELPETPSEDSIIDDKLADTARFDWSRGDLDAAVAAEAAKSAGFDEAAETTGATGTADSDRAADPGDAIDAGDVGDSVDAGDLDKSSKNGGGADAEFADIWGKKEIPPDEPVLYRIQDFERVEPVKERTLVLTKNRMTVIGIILAMIVAIILVTGIQMHQAHELQLQEEAYQARLQQAQELAEDKEYEIAEARYLALIEERPQDTEPYLELAEMYMEQQRYEDAKALIKGAIETTGDEEAFRDIEKKAKILTSRKWKKAYIEVLEENEYAIRRYEEDVTASVAVCDVNGDMRPELFFFTKEYYGYGKLHIYTMVKKKAKEVSYECENEGSELTDAFYDTKPNDFSYAIFNSSKKGKFYTYGNITETDRSRDTTNGYKLTKKGNCKHTTVLKSTIETTYGKNEVNHSGYSKNGENITYDQYVSKFRKILDDATQVILYNGGDGDQAVWDKVKPKNVMCMSYDDLMVDLRAK